MKCKHEWGSSHAFCPCESECPCRSSICTPEKIAAARARVDEIDREQVRRFKELPGGPR